MELTHSFTVPAAPAVTWGLLTDLHRVGSCFPGATVTEAGEQDFTGTVKVKLGPIAMLYAGSGRFVDRDDAGHRAVIEAQGKDKRGNGTASATVTMALAPDGSGTRADVVTDLKVTGKPAQFGRGVMQDVSDKLLNEFVACIERELGGTGEPAAEQAPAGEPAGEAAVATLSASAASDAGAAPGAAARDSAVEPPPQPFGAEVPPEPDGEAQVAALSASPAPDAGRAPRADSGPRDDAIDLGATVGPVLLQHYGGYAVAAVVGFVLGWAVGRRGR